MLTGDSKMNDVTSASNYLRAANVQMESGERAARKDLAAFYRLMVLYGMTDLSANHITARVDDEHDAFLINPYGMLYEEITASSLHKVNIAGELIQRGSPDYEVNVAGYVIHSAIHEARPDVRCIVHTHTAAGVAISCLEEGLLPLSQTALLVFNDLAYHEYEGPATNAVEKERLVQHLGDKNYMILRNHGLLACGRTIAEAFWRIYYLESSCRIQQQTMATGGKLQFPSSAATQTALDFSVMLRTLPHGNLEWPSLLRKLDRVLPGYEK